MSSKQNQTLPIETPQATESQTNDFGNLKISAANLVKSQPKFFPKVEDAKRSNISIRQVQLANIDLNCNLIPVPYSDEAIIENDGVKTPKMTRNSSKKSMH